MDAFSAAVSHWEDLMAEKYPSTIREVAGRVTAACNTAIDSLDACLRSLQSPRQEAVVRTKFAATHAVLCNVVWFTSTAFALSEIQLAESNLTQALAATDNALSIALKAFQTAIDK
jgi:hypothetical protein